MSTKKLARELGLIRKRTPSSSSLTHASSASNQLFPYLIVIDFESTCWREKNSHGQEIIEFPAVLMNTHTGELESEFHSYVQPQEHPLLSSFCTELTGITQEQVEAGLPLQICLSRFTRWLHTLQQDRGVVFPRDHTHTHTTAAAGAGKPCAFLTWSDWDLGVCLQYECKRKQITKPEVLNSWIDLRATYRIFYNRKPKGLNGALQDLGIEFSGREHSGLDDARNTARLAWRMIRDGCVMKITKSVSRAPLKSGVPLRGVCAGKGVCNKGKEKQLTHTADTHTADTHTADAHTGLQAATSSHSSVCQSLVSLRTVLSSITTPLHTLTVTHTSHLDATSTHTLNPDVTSTHTLDPDATSTHTLRPDVTSTHTLRLDTSDWSEEFLVTEFGESGSYDDVLLEDFSENIPSNSASPVCREKPHPLNPNPPRSVKDPIRSLKGLDTKAPPTIPFSIYTDQSHQSSSSSSSAVFRVPSSVLSSLTNQSSRLSVSVNQSGSSSVSKSQSRLSSCHPVSLNQSARSCISENRSTHSSFTINQNRPSCSVNQSSLFSSSKQLSHPPPGGGAKVTPSFPKKSALSSFPINQSCLSTLSVNQSGFSTSSCKRLPLPPVRGGAKITSPLCDCGRRSRRLTVCNGGPNQGRAFYACAGRRSSGPASRNSTHTGSAPHNSGCGFFKWEAALIKSSAVSRNTSVLSFNPSTAGSRNFR
ncbi:ERI1 exoribonuclease 2 [Clarias gariepinus]|uniref:ERI1 exoribonuclease 2 n=1 Tax=Clarias gariepinus TaxID=13013 RepID=UPI00234DAFCC|nr:ERI1 exoribonuclease 2 [Clarias gariepinus]